MTIRPRTSVTISISPELSVALDQAAYEQDSTRAAVVRKILVDRLRELGRFGLSAPPTVHLGQHNGRYNPHGGR